MRRLSLLAAPAFLAIAFLLQASDGLPGPLSPPGLAAPPPAESPPVNLAPELRQRNWLHRGSGSCAHASAVTSLRWRDALDAADRWRRSEGGGATEQSLRAAFGRHGVEYAMTNRGDVAFLDWLSDNRKSAIIWYLPSHAITFCGFMRDENGREVAVMVDNNRPERWLVEQRETFIRKWRNWGGFAIAPLYAPTVPKPYNPYATADT